MILQTGGEKGSLVALNSSNGKVIWQTGSLGQGMLLHFKGNQIPMKLLSLINLGWLCIVCRWLRAYQYQHKTRYGINAAQPLSIRTPS